MLKELSELFRNKKFLTSLLFVNTATFMLGFIVSDINLMLLSALSYGAVLLSLNINDKGGDDKEDG